MSATNRDEIIPIDCSVAFVVSGLPGCIQDVINENEALLNNNLLFRAIARYIHG